MEYGINVRFFEKALGLRKAAELVAKAGFTQLDYTPVVLEDNWKEQLTEARSELQKARNELTEVQSSLTRSQEILNGQKDTLQQLEKSLKQEKRQSRWGKVKAFCIGALIGGAAGIAGGYYLTR